MNIEHMSETAIAQEIDELVTKMESGELTPADALRLDKLRMAKRRIDGVRSGRSMWE